MSLPDPQDEAPGADSGPARLPDLPLPRAGSARAGMVRYVRVGRQGVYDARKVLTSYELLFRAGERIGEDEVAGEQATSQVIASTFGTFGLENIAGGKPVFINFTRAFLTGIIPIPVEPEGVIVEVVENVVVDRELLTGVLDLRREGYRISIDHYQGGLDRSALVELADYVKINVNRTSSLLMPGLVEAGKDAGVLVVAKGVEDAASFQRCQALGFDLYQGYHLQRPTVLEQRTLSPSQAICVRLLNDLADPEAPMSRIEHLVGSDPGLTMRLLRTANSAAGASQEVTSLRQALVLIGPRRLRSWVVLTLLEGGATLNSTDDLWSVLARAHACQRLAPGQLDLAFTVGLLSGAADLLGSEPAAVAEAAGIGQEARDALITGKGEAGRALVAVLAHERDDAEGIAATGLAPFDVSRAYLESLSESLQLVNDLASR
jgi:EAL and modified HD-GYP domain-containing signal transduction protein